MSIGAIGSYFDSCADGWDASSEAAGSKHLAIARLAGVCPGARVLDIGCGTGIMERAYMELGASQIVALDMSEKMIAHAKQNFADVPETQLRFECADVIEYSREAAANPDKLFDAFVIYNAYPHIADKTELMIAAFDLLKPDGRFLVAHGMGREALNAHHANVPENVTSELRSAKREAGAWESMFEIDMLADTPYIYFFGGGKRQKR